MTIGTNIENTFPQKYIGRLSAVSVKNALKETTNLNEIFVEVCTVFMLFGLLSSPLKMCEVSLEKAKCSVFFKSHVKFEILGVGVLEKHKRKYQKYNKFVVHVLNQI